MHDVAFAAAAPDVNIPLPELQEAWVGCKGVLEKLYRITGEGKELKDQVGAASVRCFFECGAKKKDLIVRAGTELRQTRAALGWLFDAGKGEHIDFAPLPDTKQVANGEVIRFNINPNVVFATSNTEEEQLKQPHIKIPASEDAGGPRNDRPTHVVCVMLENRSFDHLLGKVTLPAGHPGWHRFFCLFVLF